MSMYNLIEYSNNYSDISGSLWQFKRDEIIGNFNFTNNNSSSFKYKSNLIGNTDADGAIRKKEGVKIALPLKYLSNFWKSLEIPFIKCKVELSLRWHENCILSNVAGNSTFKIADAKLHVSVVTLSTKYNAKLSKLLTEGFKRSVYWDEYKAIPEERHAAIDNIRKLIDPSWQVINRLFVLAYLNDVTATVNLHRKYFLPRAKIENYNIEIDGRNFFDQLINELIKQYDEIRKISTGEDDDYTSGCLLDFAYFKNNYKLIAADLSKQKVLDPDSRAIQQIIFIGKTSQAAVIYYIYEKSKETVLPLSKGTPSFVTTYKWLNTEKQMLNYQILN